MADKNELTPTAQSLLVERDRLQAELESVRKYGEEFAALAERRWREVSALRTALTYIRDSSDDWHICEKAGGALIDAAKDGAQ